jgi:hypothetical protein
VRIGRPSDKPVAPSVSARSIRCARRVHAMADRKSVPPRTSKERLDKLPQFEPGYSITYNQVHFEKGERFLFPPERQQQIRLVLTGFIDAHVRSVEWDGKPTSADRFTEHAMLAIATFEYRRGAQANFDRKAAKEELKRTVGRILDTCQDLERITMNRELSHFLRSIFVSTAVRKNFARQRLTDKQALSAELKQSERLSKFYRQISPRALVTRLMRLEPILTLAAERVELQAGDFQRDEIAQELCNELAYAWICGTGEIPTVSEPSRTYRTKSPFLSLLALVNKNIDSRFHHSTEFRNYGAKARDEMRRQFPELVKVRKPRGRK